MHQVDVMKEAYAQGLESDEDEEGVGEQIKPIDVGHNIYILAHQVIRRRRQYFMVMYSEICSLHLTRPLSEEQWAATVQGPDPDWPRALTGY